MQIFFVYRSVMLTNPGAVYVLKIMLPFFPFFFNGLRACMFEQARIISIHFFFSAVFQLTTFVYILKIGILIGLGINIRATVNLPFS